MEQPAATPGTPSEAADPGRAHARAIYDAMSIDDLRHAAVVHAERHGDLAFLWRLVGHTRAAAAMAPEGGDLGAVGGSISDALLAIREVFAAHSDPGALAPMLRIVCTEYLLDHGAPGT